MINYLEHCGWFGSIEFSHEDGVLHGKLLNTKDLISYEGETVAELIRDFQESVEEYIDFCLRHGKPCLPQTTASISVKLELYRELAETAQQNNMPIETYVEQSLRHSMRQQAS
jgi:predicted HicB family RNase H-like nuclease